MPYIKQKDRDLLDEPIRRVINVLMDLHAERSGSIYKFAGSLNYVITKIIVTLWHRCPSYSTGNTLIGVLHCATYEFSRRHLGLYEDKKIRENGDVDPF